MGTSDDEELEDEFDESPVEVGAWEEDETKPEIETREEFQTKRHKTDSSHRCIALVDLDCFYVAVERDLNPSLKGIPVAVAQYTKGASLVAISYEAKALGVKRGMLSFVAQKLFPTLRIVRIQTKNDKADLTKYRSASDRVLEVASRFCSKLERASVDEFYLDLTDTPAESLPQASFWPKHTLLCAGFDLVSDQQHDDSESTHEIDKNDAALFRGSEIVWNLRQAIRNELGFDCSAGIACNKFLAKSIAGMRKPFTQIVLPTKSIPRLCETMPIRDARSLGGKHGNLIVEKFSISYLGELFSTVGLSKLCAVFGSKEGRRLYLLAQGLDDTAVSQQLCVKSMGASKTFRGKQALRARTDVTTWMKKLILEIVERLQHDGRRPSTVIVSAGHYGSKSTSTFTHPLTVDSLSNTTESLLDCLWEKVGDNGAITVLALTLSGFPVEESVGIPQHTSLPLCKWSCKTCTLENDAEWLRCQACGSSKLLGDNTLPLPKASPCSNVSPCSAVITSCWTCAVCTFASNDKRFLRCEVCTSLKQ